jgi:translation initiation factor IF-3
VLQEDKSIKSDKKKHRVGQQITAQRVLLIGPEGEREGIVSITHALGFAGEKGLDLVEIAPDANPPTCKVLDYGRMTFGNQKKGKQKSKRVQLKELKFRPTIDVGDYQVKLRNIKKFLEQGDKVKITVRFRGREMMHQDLGEKIITRVAEDVADIAVIDQNAKMEGRQIIMILSPKRK